MDNNNNNDNLPSASFDIMHEPLIPVQTIYGAPNAEKGLTRLRNIFSVFFFN